MEGIEYVVLVFFILTCEHIALQVSAGGYLAGLN